MSTTSAHSPLHAKPSLTHQQSLGQSTSATTPVNTKVKQIIKELTDNLNINGEEFTKEEFDLKTFSSAILKTNALSEHLANLTQNISTLDKEIRDQVSLHHEDLLHQAINIETLEDMLDIVQTRISSLKSTSERLKLKISTPYNELNLRILQLSRLQAACDTLRRIKGILHHTAKLRIHMHNGVKDIVKSAQALNELEFLLRNFDSNGIEIVEKDIHFVFKSRREVEDQAQNILDRSLTNQDQTQIGTALQVFYSLGVLTERLTNLIKMNEKNFQKMSAEMLDSTNLTLQSTLNNQSPSVAVGSTPPQFPGRATMPNIGSMSQFRAQIWANVEKLMDIIYDSCSQIFYLQQILEKKKDILTNVYYIDEVDFTKIFNGKMYLSNLPNANNESSTDNLNDSLNNLLFITPYDSICSIIDTNEFNSKKTIELLYDQWKSLTNILNSSIVTACNQSNYIKQTFQNEYPKLLKLQNDLWLRLLQLNPLIDRYRYLIASEKTNQNYNSPSNYQSSYELLRKCFLDLENSYLNRSLSHLFDPINLIFSQSSDKPINKNDIETYLKGIQTQLQTLQYDIFNSNSSALTAFGVLNKSNNQLQNITLSGCSSAFSEKIISNICKSIQMYANKSEQILNSLNAELQQLITNTTVSGGNAGTTHNQSGSSSSTSSNLSGIFAFSSAQSNQIQNRNLDYFNVTYDLHEQLNRLFTNSDLKLIPKLSDKLNGALNSLNTFQENALSPFIIAASDCIYAIILTMHQEDFSSTNQSYSLYVRELQQVLQRICRDYLQLYNCKSILNPNLNRLAIRCFDLFTRHGSILRPMNDTTRQRLIVDSNKVESIVQNLLCNKLTDLGMSYKQFKSFRNLLQLSSPLEPKQPSSLGEEIVDENHYNQVLNESLSYSILLHYLFSFAPTDFKSPHQSLNWPISRYSEWLDKHQNEKERLLVIKTCLEAYVNLVKQKKEKTFATIYPLMFRLLEKGLQSFVITN